MRRIALSLVVGSLGVALTGCPASVSGELDGTSVDMLYSAFFIQQETEIGEDTIINVSSVGLSVLDGCNAAAKQQENTNELFKTMTDDLDGEDDPDNIKDINQAFLDGQVEYEVKNFPTDYWRVNLGAAAPDAGDIDGDIDIDLEDPDPDADANAGVSLCKTNDHPEVDEDNDVFSIKRDEDCFTAKKGTLTVDKFDEEKTFTVKFEGEVIAQDDDGSFDIDDNGDEIEVSLSGGFCEPLQTAIEDFNDLLEEALEG